MCDRVKDKREAIIKAAAEVFSQKGFHQARVEEIARKAGIGKGTVYEYFNSKEELLKEVLSYIVRQHVKIFAGEIDEKTSAVEQIKEILKQHFNFMGRHRNIARLLLENNLFLSLNEEIRTWLLEKKLEKIAALERVLQKGVAEGEFREDFKPGLAAHLIFGAVMAVGSAVVHGDPNLDGDCLADSVIDLLLSGLKK